jgi:hypothetical protein
MMRLAIDLTTIPKPIRLPASGQRFSALYDPYGSAKPMRYFDEDILIVSIARHVVLPAAMEVQCL